MTLLTSMLGRYLSSKGGHCSKGSGAHGDIGQLVCGAVSMYCVEVGSGAVHSSHDKIPSNVALVLEQVLLQHPQSSHHTRLGREREREKEGGEEWQLNDEMYESLNRQ